MDDDQTLWARWDEQLGIYRINPEKLAIPGMAEHAAQRIQGLNIDLVRKAFKSCQPHAKASR